MTHPATPEILEIERTAPHLMPLWRALQQGGYLEGWQERYLPQEVLKALKSATRRIGLSETGWRLLCRLNKRQVRDLVGRNEKTFARDASRIGVINFLAHVGVELPASPIVFSRLVWLITNADLKDGKAKAMLLVLIRAACHEAREWTGHKLDFAEELAFVADWFRHEYLQKESRALLDLNRRSTNWGWFVRKAEAWHRQAYRTPPRKKGVRWESLLGPFRFYGFDVIPLVSVEQLYDEGNEMEHCIVTYEKYCVVGKSRIFSIRDRGRTLATFELGQRDGVWHLIQVRGWRNANPGPVYAMIARETLYRYRAAWAKQVQKDAGC